MENGKIEAYIFVNVPAIASWCMDYCERHILPVFEKRCSDDNRPQNAIVAARDWLEGRKKLPEVKNTILKECRSVARELDTNPVTQAAAGACAQAAACFHTPTHSLGLAFYGTAAIACDRVGLKENPFICD